MEKCKDQLNHFFPGTQTPSEIKRVEIKEMIALIRHQASSGELEGEKDLLNFGFMGRYCPRLGQVSFVISFVQKRVQCCIEWRRRRRQLTTTCCQDLPMIHLSSNTQKVPLPGQIKIPKKIMRKTSLLFYIKKPQPDQILRYCSYLECASKNWPGISSDEEG